MGAWNADGANLTLTGADDSNGFLFRLRPMSQRVNDSPAVIPELVGSIDSSTSAYKYSNSKLTWTDDKGVIADLGGAGIVSQQLGLNGYTKYADGRLKMWGCVYVDRNDASVSSTENPGFKFHENYKTVTFPVTVKEIHNVVAVPNALHGVYYESCCIRVKNNSSLNVILIGLQRLADDIMGVDNKVWYLLHGTWK